MREGANYVTGIERARQHGTLRVQEGPATAELVKKGEPASNRQRKDKGPTRLKVGRHH